ncbi:MAG: chemotaxis-specific protein-glutamate methyltransferase CheB [Spirochaetales bacterium]|nr:chemotaxis-specific protein-glutamate methyltransferase CheB [Spirochaetales bacterium]
MKTIRLLVVDDSSVVHLVLEKIIKEYDGIEIVGQAYNGREGVDYTKKLSPDVIIMDINMPGIDGLQAIAEIMNEKPTPIIVFSSASAEIVDLSFKSIEMGAVDIIEKPFSTDPESLKQQIRQKLIRTIKTFADFRVMRRIKNSTITALTDKSEALKTVGERLKKKHEELLVKGEQIDREENRGVEDTEFPVIGIAASTGGPQTIRMFVENTHCRKIQAAIVIVQHMAEGFLQGFSDWLQIYSPIPVGIVKNGEPVKPHRIYIAPGEFHLGFKDNRFIYIDRPPILGIRPSANIMFESLAEAFKQRAVAVILTGMGDDGVKGLAAVKQNNGLIIAQNEESCILFGMPKAAIDSGQVDTILSVSEITEFLAEYSLKREYND